MSNFMVTQMDKLNAPHYTGYTIKFDKIISYDDFLDWCNRNHIELIAYSHDKDRYTLIYNFPVAELDYIPSCGAAPGSESDYWSYVLVTPEKDAVEETSDDEWYNKIPSDDEKIKEEECDKFIAEIAEEGARAALELILDDSEALRATVLPNLCCSREEYYKLNIETCDDKLSDMEKDYIRDVPVGLIIDEISSYAQFMSDFMYDVETAMNVIIQDKECRDYVINDLNLDNMNDKDYIILDDIVESFATYIRNNSIETEERTFVCSDCGAKLTITEPVDKKLDVKDCPNCGKRSMLYDMD